MSVMVFLQMFTGLQKAPLLGMSVLSMWNNPVATEWIFIKFDN
jgi:hypothetical protein